MTRVHIKETQGSHTHTIIYQALMSLFSHAERCLPSAVVVDDLHCVYLEVVLHLLHLWFDKKRRHVSLFFGQMVQASCLWHVYGR